MPIRVISCPKAPVQRPKLIAEAIRNFMKGIKTLHAKDAALLPYIIAHAEENNIAYVLQAVPALGYYMQKVNLLEYEE